MPLLSLLRIDVRAGELRSAAVMVLHSFFIGTTTVFFETAASALFLSNFDAGYLPFVYLAASGVSILTGAGYTRIRSVVPFSTLMTGTLLFLLGVIGLIRLGLSWFETGWLFFALMVAYRLISILTDLEFWSVAARLYDVRQSKRLFGMIGSGEVIARIVGSFSVPMLLRFLQVQDLIWLSAIGLTLSIVTLLILFQAFPHVARSDAEKEGATEQRLHDAPTQTKAALFDDPYLRPIYLLALCAVLGKYFVDFAFLSQLQTRHVDVARLASFFAVFSGSTQALNLLIRLFVSGQLLTRFGLRVGLLILPIAHLICTVAMIGFFHSL